MFFDICDLTMRTESPILLLLSPSTKFDVNLFDDILLPTPLKKYSFSPKKNLKFAKNNKKINFRECFASFFCRKKERKNFTVQNNVAVE